MLLYEFMLYDIMLLLKTEGRSTVPLRRRPLAAAAASDLRMNSCGGTRAGLVPVERGTTEAVMSLVEDKWGLGSQGGFFIGWTWLSGLHLVREE